MTTKIITEFKLIPLENLVFNKNNVRVKNDASHLISSIEIDGIKVPIVVLPLKNGKYEIQCGHCRATGATDLKGFNPEAFDKHFKDGLPCDVITNTNLTKLQLATIMLDHGNTLGLQHKLELFWTCRRILEQNGTKQDFIMIASASLDLLHPLSSDKKRQIENAKKISNIEYQRVLKLKRYGIAQFYERVHLGPIESEHWLEYCAGIREEALKLTYEDTKVLRVEHKKDLLLIDEKTGVCPFDRVNHGPNVEKALLEIKTKLETKSKKEPVKLMKRDDIEKLGTLLTNEVAKALIAVVIKNVEDPSYLMELDRADAKKKKSK